MSTNNNNKLLISYSDAYLNWKLGSGDGSHPTNPVRAKLAVEMLEAEAPEAGLELEIIEPTFEPGDREKLLEIHAPEYVREVLDFGESAEWVGVDKVNAETAGLMFGGTVRLVERMLTGEYRVAFNPQGAKHHAHAEYSSGFCVFNDMAWAAVEFVKAGKKVVYIDWDAHAGDGVQAILSGVVDAPTFSVHGHGIFPSRRDTSIMTRGDGEGNYLYMDEANGWYNYNLVAGQGDDALLWAVDDICNKALDFTPDVILLATGADGHEGEYWGLKYTLDGYVKAAEKVAALAERFGASVLIGGAGGYQPYSWTPRIWAEVVKTISSRL